MPSPPSGVLLYDTIGGHLTGSPEIFRVTASDRTVATITQQFLFTIVFALDGSIGVCDGPARLLCCLFRALAGSLEVTAVALVRAASFGQDLI